MHFPKIVFLDGYTVNPGDLGWKKIEALGTLMVYDRTAPEDVLTRAAEAEIIIVNKTRLTAETINALPALRLICVAATGFDVVDIKAARSRNIPVCNCAGYSTRAVAQMVMAHILEVTNSVGSYSQRCHEGGWSRSADFCMNEYPQIELVGRKAAIVGFGNIGRAVSDVMRPFGLQLHAVTSKPQEALPADVAKISLEEAFASCDFVSLNCPLTPDNRQFVNAALLAKANPRLTLVNTARGGLVDDRAVADALSEGRLFAYCADVMSQEPPSADNPLLSAPRCFLTPHVAWATADARARIINIIADNIEAYLAGTPKSVVN